jgi:hypothetical protein
MICPSCGFENTDTSAYCERCRSGLHIPEYTLEQTEYKAPPPPPLNGHNKIAVPPPPPSDIGITPPPPSTEYEYGYGYNRYSQIFAEQKITPQARIGVFSGILYFASLLLAAFGLMGIVTTFGTTARIGGIALLLGIAAVIIGCVVFVRLRRRIVRLRWWQRIVGILTAAFVAFIALIIEVLVSPNPLLTNYFTACIIFLYGLICAAIAVW